MSRRRELKRGAVYTSMSAVGAGSRSRADASAIARGGLANSCRTLCGRPHIGTTSTRPSRTSRSASSPLIRSGPAAAASPATVGAAAAWPKWCATAGASASRLRSRAGRCTGRRSPPPRRSGSRRRSAGRARGRSSRSEASRGSPGRSRRAPSERPGYSYDMNRACADRRPPPSRSSTAPCASAPGWSSATSADTST